MARPSNTEERRGQIISALLKVMARRGYDGASIADIARAARLTPGLVHYHFENKREILLAALDDLVRRHDERLTERLSRTAGDSAGEVEAFVDFHLGLGADADPEALACWILLSGEALREPKVRAAYERALASWTARLAAIIERGVAERSFRCGSPAAAAAALIATIQGYLVLAGAARSVIPRGSAAECTKAMAKGLLS